MTIALGAHVSAATGASGLAITTATRTTAASGSTFSVAVVWFASGGVGAAPTVTDSKLNTYVQVGAALTNGNNRCAIFECVNGTGGTLHTFTATFLANQDVISIWANEITGALTASPRDQAPGGNDDTASPYTSLTTGTTAQANEILIAYGFTLSVSGTEVFTWGNSFVGTGDDQTNANADFTGTSGTLIVSAIGTYQASFTSTGAGSTEALVFIVSYKDATPGGSSSDSAQGAMRRLLSGSLPHLRMKGNDYANVQNSTRVNGGNSGRGPVRNGADSNADGKAIRYSFGSNHRADGRAGRRIAYHASNGLYY